MDITKLARINEHSSIRLGGAAGTPEALLLPTLYFDPFRIPVAVNDADIIFITHEHYDHFSPEDIARVQKPGTHFVIPHGMEESVYALGATKPCIHALAPGEKAEVRGLTVRAIRAYNLGKKFHPRANDWLGYQVFYDNTMVYVAGDTDTTPEYQGALASSDIAFLPVGGTYTSAPAEAAAAVDEAIAQGSALSVVVPTHYGTVVGTPEDGPLFKQLVSAKVEIPLLVGATENA